MSDQNQLEECIRYFRQRKIYDRLFVKVAEKYRSLGRFGGTVRLSGLCTEDCRQLGGFFQKDYEGQKTVTISAAASFTVKFRETDRSTDCLPLSMPTKVWEEKTGSPSSS